MSEKLLQFLDELKEEYERQIGWSAFNEEQYQRIKKTLMTTLFLRKGPQAKGVPGFVTGVQVDSREFDGIPTEKAMGMMMKRFTTIRDMTLQLFKLYREIEEAKAMLTRDPQTTKEAEKPRDDLSGSQS